MVNSRSHPAMKQKIAFFIYYSLAVTSLFLGTIYLLSPQFMWYHSQAIEMDWIDLSPPLQILLLALMKVTGAGWVALGVSLLILLHFGFLRGHSWSRWAIPLIGLIFYGPTLYVTIWVTLNTPGTAPWYGSLLAVMMLLMGFSLAPVNPFPITHKTKP
jgi:hypothetical protein